MSAPTATQLLDEANQAISDLLTSNVAEMSDNEQRFVHNRLHDLQLLRTQLQQEVDAQNNQSFRLFAPLRKRP